MKTKRLSSLEMSADRKQESTFVCRCHHTEITVHQLLPLMFYVSSVQVIKIFSSAKLKGPVIYTKSSLNLGFTQSEGLGLSL